MIGFRNISSTAALALGLGLGLGTSAPASAAIVGVSFLGQVVTIDATTGTSSPIGTSGFLRLNSLATDNSGVLFSATDRADNVAGDDVLLTINPTTGVATLAVTLNFGAIDPDVRSMAFRPSDNALFAINAGGGSATSSNSLFRIDPVTGIGTLIAVLGNTGMQGLDFSPTGTLYGWSGSLGLVTIDASTGAVSDVNAAAGGSLLQSIAFDASGTLFGASQTALYTVDLTTGVQTLIGSGLSDVRGIESLGANVVPLPDTLALLGLGATVLLAQRRQRPQGPLRLSS